MAYCLNHPLTEASRVCSRCKRPLCADCLVPLQGTEVCAACKHEALKQTFRAYPIQVPTAPSWHAGNAGPGSSSAPMGSQSVGEFDLGALTAAAPIPANPAPVPVLGACAFHPNNPAYSTCDRCGDFMCGLCNTAFEGKNYCIRCFDLMWQRGALEARRFSAPQNALWLGILSLFVGLLPGCGWPVCIAALVVGVNALRRIARQPDLPGKGLAYAGSIMGGLSLLASIGFLIWLIVRGS